MYESRRQRLNQIPMFGLGHKRVPKNILEIAFRHLVMVALMVCTIH